MVIFFGVRIQATSNSMTSLNKRASMVAPYIVNEEAHLFSCTCSCDRGESNCSGHCQIFVTCDTVAECFKCISDCCRDLQIQ